MKPTPVIHEGETDTFTRKGSTIGWVIPAKDETGFYASYGSRLKKNFFGSKHTTHAEAVAAIVKVQANLKNNVEVI